MPIHPLFSSLVLQTRPTQALNPENLPGSAVIVVNFASVLLLALRESIYLWFKLLTIGLPSLGSTTQAAFKQEGLALRV